MKASLTSLLLLLSVSFLFAQSTKSKLELVRISGHAWYPAGDKMPCSSTGGSPITILSCEGEPANPDGPVNGAPMTWTATGSNNFYYSRIYNGPDTFQIVQAGTNNSVYSAGAGGNYTGTLAIGIGTNTCLPAGTWTVQVWDVMDANGDLRPDRVGGTNNADDPIIGCFTECTFLFQPSCLPDNEPAFTATVTDIGCTSDGSIELSDFQLDRFYCTNINGFDLTFSWTGPGGFTSTSSSISGLAPGSYTVVVEDFYGCTSTLTETVNFIDPVTINCPVTGTPPTTVGGTDGSAIITILTGSGDYSISWSGPSSGSRDNAVDGPNLISNLSPGTYTFIVTDDISGCTETCMVTIEEPPCVIDFSVMLDADGNVVITILGGLPDYLLEYVGPTERLPFGPIGPGGITLPAMDFIPGDYTFILYEEDRTLCEAVRTLTVPPVDCSDLTFTLVDLQEPECGGIDDGLIEISFTGNFNPVIVWTGPGIDGDGNPFQNNLGPGTYSFEIFDSRDCTLEDTYTFTTPPALTMTCGAVGETLASRNDGMIGYRLTGGSPAYRLSYTATDPDGNPLPPVNDLLIATQDTLRNLQAGTYVLVITDDIGCTTTCTAEVTEPNCTLSVGCSVTNPITAGGTGSLTVMMDGNPDWTVMITGPRDSTFTTSNSSETISGLPQGVYVVEVYNSEGCIGSCFNTIEGPSCDLAFSATTEMPSCAGGNDGVINLDITGAAPGLVIDWDVDAYDGMDTVRNLPAGSYTVTLSDQTGCPVAPQTITVADPDELVVMLNTPAEIACNGDSTGTILAGVSGTTEMVTFEWSVDSLPDNSVVNGLVAGTYHVLVTSESGCTARDTIVLGQPEVLMLDCSAVGETSAGAMDGTITVSFSGGGAGAGEVVRLSGDLGVHDITAGADSTFLNLGPGTYNLIVTNANGCTDQCTAIVSQGGCDISVMAVPTQPDCGNPLGSATAQVTDPNGMVTYLWSNDSTTATITDLMPGTYGVTVTDALGCEALDEVTITAFTDFPSISNVVIAPVCDADCAAIEFELSGTPPFNITYEFTRPNGMTTITNFMAPTAGAGSETVCPGDYGLTSLEGVTIDLMVLTDGTGCNQLLDIERDINIFPLADALGILDTTVCIGAEVNYFGEVFNATRLTGDVVVPTPSVNGCDSTVTVNLSFFPAAVSTLDTTICEGTDLDYFGEIFNAARLTGDVVVPTPSVNGCDSTVTVNLSFFPAAVSTLDTTICEGTDLDYFGEIFNAARLTGDVVVPTPSVNGCDSTVTVNLSFFPAAVSTLDTMICAGTDLDYFGEIFNAARLTGDVIVPTPSVNGCDSTVTVNLSFFPAAVSTLDTTICADTDLDYFGEIFNAARLTGDVVVPTPSVNGCDSTVTVNLSFFPAAVSTLDTTICEGTDLDYFGEIFNAARLTGDVVVPTPSVNGCDSTVTVNLSFFPAAVSTLDTTICADTDLDYFGEIFNAARLTGDVVVPTPSVNGCDSTVTVNLSFFPAAVSTLDTTICAGTDLDYFGEIFNAARLTGDVVVPTPSVNGCDSTVTVNLSFFPAAVSTLDTTICAGTDLDYFGEIFNAARLTGDVVVPTPSVNGCDSTVTVNLSFFSAAVSTLDTTICEGTDLDYFGEIFNAARPTGDVVVPTPSVNGCDSTVTVNLSFFPAAVSTLDTTICEGTDLDYFGEVFNAARLTGDVVVPTPSVNGCDSTVTVNLSFFPAAVSTLDTTICAGTDLDYFGEVFNAARLTGDVVVPTPSVNGCDSTVTVTVTFFAPAFSALDTTICGGTQLNYFGEIFDANRTTGDVIVPTPALNGCDSTVTVNLSFFPQAAGVIDTTICAGTTFDYAGQSFSEAVNGELVTIPEPTANGCDSIVAVTVRIEQVPTVTLSGEGIICAGGALDITLNYDGPGTAMITLSSDPGEVITISSGETTIQRMVAPGTSVRINSASNAGNCQPITNGVIDVQETDLSVRIDVMSGDGVFAVSCAEGSDGDVIALGEGGAEPYAFQWNTGDLGPRLGRLGVGGYSVVLTSARGCEAEASVSLTAPEPMVAAIAEVPANCLDTLPSLIIRDIQGGVGPYLYRTTTDGSFQPLMVFPDTLGVAVGQTNLQLEDTNGCLLEHVFDLAGPPVSEVFVSPARPVIAQGDSVELTLITDLDIAGFRLTPGPDELIPGNSVFVGPLESTTYEIFVVDAAGCTADAEVQVFIDDYVPVYAPNAFSPNGDGRNDFFQVYGKSTVVSFRNFNVFNRWGHLVYTLEGPIDPRETNWGWDGRNEQGVIHEPAVYVYSIEVELADGRVVTIKSDMVLMR